MAPPSPKPAGHRCAPSGVSCTIGTLARPAVFAASLALLGCRDDAVAPATDETGDGSTGAAPGTTDGSTSVADDGEGTSSSTTSGADEESSGSTGDPPVPALEWTEQCTGGGADFGDQHPRLQCTSIEVPLNWDDPEGESIVVAAFRVPTEASERVGALWHLDGGPGGSGLGFFLESDRVAAVNAAGLDFVAPAHRGTISPRLSCGGVVESTGCRESLDAEWGEGLQHFNTVQAAHDVAELLHRDDPEGEAHAVVYGVSYGSYWAQFLLGAHPDAADAVILDSVLAADADVTQQEALVHSRAVDLLQRCVDDPVCGPRVGHASGEAFAQAVIDAVNDGDCGVQDLGTWVGSNYHSRLGTLLNTKYARNYLPLLASMLERCLPDDSELAFHVADALVNAAFADAPPPAPGIDHATRARDQARRYGVPFEFYFSPVTLAVVVATTLVPDGVDVELGDDVLTTIGIPSLLAATMPFYADLPNVAFDPDFSPEVPVLILAAEYDLQTPLAWADGVAERFGEDVVVFPDGQHSLVAVGTGGKDLEGNACALPITLQFALAPREALDLDCVQTLPDIDVNLERPDLQSMSLTVFGTADPWSL